MLYSEECFLKATTNQGGTMIGTSISNCILDILEGKVAISAVQKIVAGTRCVTEDDWKDVIGTYRRVYWHRLPATGEAILRSLIQEGRIEQPRLTNPRMHPIRPDNGYYWVEDEGEITYNDPYQIP